MAVILSYRGSNRSLRYRDGLIEAIYQTSCPLQVGKLRIKKVPGQKHDVNFTLSDSICAPVAGLNEFDKNALVS